MQNYTGIALCSYPLKRTPHQRQQHCSHRQPRSVGGQWVGARAEVGAWVAAGAWPEAGVVGTAWEASSVVELGNERHREHLY